MIFKTAYNMNQPYFPYAYFNGVNTYFNRSQNSKWSWFGGPHEFSIRQPRNAILHHVCTLRVDDIGVDYKFGFTIPFLYPIQHESGEIHYSKIAHLAVNVSKISPKKPSKDWPYKHYPKLFPYIPLEILEKREASIHQFSGLIPSEFEECKDDTLVLVVPPNPQIGMSLFGNSGDANMTTILFFYNTRSGYMHGFSTCT